MEMASHWRNYRRIVLKNKALSGTVASHFFQPDMLQDAGMA